MPRYVTEFIGTFFLVLTIGLVVVGGTALGPIVIGSALMVMVYMGGPVSGAHYNPAVSVAILMRGKMERADFVPYVVSQLIGAMVATLAVRAISGESFAPAPGAGVSVTAALLVEVLFTFALALVVLNVATSKRTEGNSYYGLAIGFTIAVGAATGGGISGGAYNPAVGLGPTIVHGLVGGGSIGDVWLYLVGPLIGGVAAVFVFQMQEGHD